MTALVLIRHGPTQWNAEGRLQGSTDIGLSELGRAAVNGWTLPDEFADFERVCSPLSRARETAEILLGPKKITTEPLLTEMSWGQWEGRVLSELRAELGPEMAANEDYGIDFQPPGGESPRAVQVRLAPWLQDIARAGRPTIGVTHKGVIRAVMARAFDWDMIGKAPLKLAAATAHMFVLGHDGRPRPERMNIALDAKSEKDQS